MKNLNLTLVEEMAIEIENLEEDVQRIQWSIEDCTKAIAKVLSETNLTIATIHNRNSRFSYLTKQLQDYMREQEKKANELQTLKYYHKKAKEMAQ